MPSRDDLYAMDRELWDERPRPAEERDAAFSYRQADAQERVRHPFNAVGKTIARIIEWGYVSEIYFTDGTKMRVEPAGLDAEATDLIYHADPAAD